jgi:hypothetical protein
MNIREEVRKRFSSSAIPRMRKALSFADRVLLSWWCPNDLNRLAMIFGTDKWGCHWYTQHYDRYFSSVRSKKLNVLEIGVGGYERPAEGGRSLRMWKAYFPKSRIVSIDIKDYTSLSERRIDVRQLDQTDAAGLTRLSDEYGGFDIIIDDGSHLNAHVITTFKVLFPLLRANGIYAVEDTQTAYWPSCGGGIDAPGSSVNFFKKLVDGINHAEYAITDYKPSYFDENIVEIAFFHNLLFVRKGRNDEGTNNPSFIQYEVERMNEIETR